MTPASERRLQEDLTRLLANVAGTGSSVPGAQLSIRASGTDVDVAVGESGTDRPMDISVLHHLWCATRPIVAMGVLKHCEEAGIDPTTPTRFLGEPWAGSPAAQYSIADLLAHQTALTRPLLLEAQMLPAQQLAHVAKLAASGDGGIGFSEFRTWKLLDLWFARVAGADLTDFLERAVIGPLALRDEIVFGLDLARLAALRERLGPQQLSDSFSRFSYHDRAESFATYERISFGGYATTRGLVASMEAIGSALGGADLPGLPSAGFLEELFMARPPRRHDAKLGRVCSFSLGCMTDLADHGFPGFGDRAIGTAGWQGRSFAVADPDRELAFGLVLNGPLDPSRSWQLREASTRLALAVAA